MSSKNIINPWIAVEETCTMLKEAGASKEVINYFILESYMELHNEILEESIADFFSHAGKVVTRGFSIVGDQVKEVLVRFILDKLGIADGWIKETLIKFIGNLTPSEMIKLTRGELPCDVVMTKSAQTMAEVVVEKYLVTPLLAGSEPGGPHPESSGADKNSQIAGVFRGIIRNALSGSDLETSPLARALRPHMKPVCDLFDGVSDYFQSLFRMDETLYNELVKFNSSNSIIKENFQKRMKVRLKKSMKTLLDGGRKDLTKHGKPWSQPRQKHSNAFVAKEVSAVPNITGAPVANNKNNNNKENNK